jgi:RNA polymerase sigma-70 factor (ECF subfamily)
MGKEARHTFVSTIASRYGQRLRRFFALRVRNVADASDLAQEVFLRLMRVENHETIRSPEAYLFTVASHVLHQHTLRQATAPVCIDILEVFAELQLTSADDPAGCADTQQQLEEVERVLAQLPPKMSTTLLLHRLAGFSIEEIGQKLGVSRPTAKKYLARALMHCRDAREEGAGRGTL